MHDHLATEFTSYNPASGEAIWSGLCADAAKVDTAVRTARGAFPTWRNTALATRLNILESFREHLITAQDELAALISRETGKPLWEARTEAAAMAGKIPLTIRAYDEQSGERVVVSGNEKTITTRYQPHGVVAVFGPFNFPGHLPNGHIAPALLAGNTVVFKPSELTPAVGAWMAQAWTNAGLPPGVLSIIQGAKETGEALAQHPDLDGIFFTGSSAVGQAIHATYGGRPECILALEMGGNNPLVVWEIADVDMPTAALVTIQSAFITAGQRCTCARRLIVSDDENGAAFLNVLTEHTRAVRVGLPTSEPEPFIGTVISADAAARAVAAADALQHAGGETLLPLRVDEACDALLYPGITDVTKVRESDRLDEEIFAPFLQVIRVRDFAAAMVEANRTRYGLAAGLLCPDESRYAHFRRAVRAGIINWNQPTTGASGAAPFGGIGASGNHRPSAYAAAQYCSYPIASIESTALMQPDTLPPGLSNAPER